MHNFSGEFSNLGQMTNVPLLSKLKDVRSTTTMIEELIKLQSEVVSFLNSIFTFDLNLGWFIYIK